MGGIHNKAIQIMSVGFGSLALLLISIQFPSTIQSLADQLFATYIPYPQVRLALFDAAFLTPFWFFAIWSIRGVHGHGYSEGKIDGQG